MNQLLANKKFHEQLAEQFGSEFNAGCYSAEERAALGQPAVRLLVLEAIHQRREFSVGGLKLSSYIVSALSTGPNQGANLPPALRSALEKFDARYPAADPLFG